MWNGAEDCDGHQVEALFDDRAMVGELQGVWVAWNTIQEIL